MTNVRTGLVRLTYVHLDKPYAFEEGNTPKYSTGMIIRKELRGGRRTWRGKIRPELQN